MRRVRAAVVAVAALAAVVAVAVALAVALGPTLSGLRAAGAGRGAWAPLAFAAVYGLACLSPLPKTPLTLAAGGLFGAVGGTVVVVAGGLAGALAAFALARGVARGPVRRLLGPRAAAWDARLRRRTFVPVLVARLVPVVPFTTLNYVAGLSAARPAPFAAATALGMLPATGAYVVLGEHGDDPGGRPFLAALGALVLLTGAGAAGALRARRRARPGPRLPAMTAPRADDPTDRADDDRVPSRAELLPEEQAMAVQDPDALAGAVLEESDARSAHPGKDAGSSEQTADR